MCHRIKDSDDKELISDVSFVLLDQALLVSGGELKEPTEFVKRVNRLLAR